VPGLGEWERFRDYCLNLPDDAAVEVAFEGRPRLAQACRELRANPQLTLSEIAKRLGVTSAALSMQIAKWRTPAPDPPPRRQGEAREEGPRPRGTSAGFTEVLRALGSEYAEIVKRVAEKADWFIDAVTDIGFYAVLAAFQFAKVDPKDIPKKVEEFKDPEEFKKFVVNYLSAMIQAGGESAAVIEKLQREVARLRTLVKAYRRMIDLLVAQRDKALEYLRMLLVLVPEESVANFLYSAAISEMLNAWIGVGTEEAAREKEKG
jgi:predicted transcriptional regulator